MCSTKSALSVALASMVVTSSRTEGLLFEPGAAD
jgi:hypothetical protein